MFDLEHQSDYDSEKAKLCRLVINIHVIVLAQMSYEKVVVVD
jgi:hypothetical protein